MIAVVEQNGYRLINHEALKASLGYLASPYTTTDVGLQERRYWHAMSATMQLMKAGIHVLSPLALGWPLETVMGKTNWEDWKQYDADLISRADYIVVLMLNGWRNSVGVQEEVRIADRAKKPVFTISPYEDGNLRGAYAENRMACVIPEPLEFFVPPVEALLERFIQK